MSEDVPEEPARQELRRQFRFAAVIGGVSLLIISWYLDSLSPHHQIHNLLSISGLLLLIIGLHAQSAEKALTVVESLADWLGMGAIHMLGLLYAFFLALITRSAAGDAKIAHVNAHTAIWFMSILLATLVTLDWTRIREYRKPSIDQISLLGFVLVSAFTLRAFMITEIPFGVTGDEGGTGFAALDYLSGSRTNILASGWFEFPALYYWIASKFLSLIGDRLLAIRLISAVGGTLAVSALYFALSKMFTREHAAIGASLLAINHVHIVFSRGAMNNIWDGVFIMVAVGALWQAWKTNDRNAFILTGLALGFSQFFYTTGHLTPVYILLWIPLLQREYPIRERLPGLILAFTIATIIFLPLGMHYINQPEKLLIPMKRVSILNADWVKTTSQVTGKSAYQL
ncbi:MAG: glycosyltransferase family 39 protein, partial [Anaerolineales bacterium]